MQVAVIGGGVVGVSTAYFLAQAGHEVVVLERQSNVAEGASFGSSGVSAPTHALPWAAPRMPKKILARLFKPETPVWIAPRIDAALWRWIRSWMAECDYERYLVNLERMHRIASYSAAVMQDLEQAFPFEYERTQGYLQLFRTSRELETSDPLRAFLTERGILHELVEPARAWAIEPALAQSTALVGGLYLPHENAGNCPLFVKQLRAAAQALGVTFHFGAEVTALEAATAGDPRLHLRVQDQRFGVDAVVVAAGAGSIDLLAPFGIRLPFYPVRRHAATASIRNFDDAPLAALADTAYQVAITRIGTRIRLAGVADLGARTPEIRAAAIRTLLKVGQDWFPDAANYNTATFWSGDMPTLPDGPPILGATPVRNLYVNIGHAENAWSMAAGAARVVADLVSGRAPEIDLHGLTVSRYG